MKYSFILFMACLALTFWNCSQTKPVPDFVGVFSEHKNGKAAFKITHNGGIYLLHSKNDNNDWFLKDTLSTLPEDKLADIFGEEHMDRIYRGLLHSPKEKVFGSSVRTYFFQIEKDENTPYFRTGYRFLTTWGRSTTKNVLYKLEEED